MTTGSGTYLSSLSWMEAEALLKVLPIGLLPIGAIEAHGPHLPLDTDVIIARAMAESAWDGLTAAGTLALILPEIVYSVSFAGLPFSGTTPVAADIFEAYLGNVLASLAQQGFRAIVCCNAHLEPAHVEAIQAACRQTERRCDIPILCPDQRATRHAVSLGDEFQAGSRHAGSYETSILLATQPDAVRIEAMRGLEPVWIDLPERLREGARTFREAGSRDGYFGDPARATADEGRQLLLALGSMIVESCREAGVLASE